MQAQAKEYSKKQKRNQKSRMVSLKMPRKKINLSIINQYSILCLTKLFIRKERKVQYSIIIANIL